MIGSSGKGRDTSEKWGREEGRAVYIGRGRRGGGCGQRCIKHNIIHTILLCFVSLLPPLHILTHRTKRGVASSLRTRSLPIHTLVFGSPVKVTQRYATTRSSPAFRGACTSLEVGVVFWRITIFTATHLLGSKFAQGATPSLGTIEFIMVTMAASMW